MPGSYPYAGQYPAAFKYITIYKFIAYRCITRAEGDYSVVNRQDMRSYPELGVRLPRGLSEDNPDYYSTSLNTNINKLKQDLKFPRPNKKIAKGNVFKEGGPQLIKKGGTHVSWWVYEELDVSDFVIVEDENG